MSGEFPHRERRRLDPVRYHQLRLRILERDGWKCQRCGRRDELQIHHLIHRSQSGEDHEANLIVLCAGCHRAIHVSKLNALNGAGNTRWAPPAVRHDAGQLAL